MAGFFDDDVVVVDLQDADIVLAYEFLDVAAARDFIKGDLLLHDFVRGVDEDLEHVDLLLDLPRELLDPVGAGADDNREFMDARERRLGSRQAFDVDIAAREDRRDLAQQPDLVLRKYGDDILLFHTSFGLFEPDRRHGGAGRHHREYVFFAFDAHLQQVGAFAGFHLGHRPG